ncbi:MAG: copper homeostasis protein CutC [Chlorobia bacterium]|nr:copper homeostasis protein CutC [Fimbriimonadaceae bacterium]
MPKIPIEIVCCSVDDCVEAAEGGADRIELCGAITVGGLTPSIGTLIEAKRRVSLPIVAMVRPRGAGFAYSEAEFGNMVADADQLLIHGADGLVFGALNDDGTLNVLRMRRIVDLVADKDKVCHRCFDVVPDPAYALEQLVDLGITRLLTSGQRAFASDGAPLIRKLVEQAAGRIEILPAGGLRMHNILDFLRETGCQCVHLAPLIEQTDPSTLGNPEIEYAPTSLPKESVFHLIDRAQVSAVVSAVRN